MLTLFPVDVATAFAVAEIIAVIGIAYLELSHACRRGDGGLTKCGIFFFVVYAVILVVGVIGGQLASERTTLQYQERIEQLIYDLFAEGGERVMNTPEGLELALPAPASESIRIVSPKDGSTVEARTLIHGEVLDPASQVWVVVHPMGTGAYWIQPAISVRRTGEWSVTAYLGRPGPIDVGKTFEVLAIVDPRVALREGEIFDKWPDARLASSVILVTRQ